MRFALFLLELLFVHILSVVYFTHFKYKLTSIFVLHLRGIVAGVVHLHKLGIIHGNLKPQNVLIIKDRSLCVKLSDMGINQHVPGKH